jgi:diguanylate cyclase (GGDEF)-like protein/PAS domain S-box-containing protein
MSEIPALFYHTLFDDASDAIFLIQDGIFTDCNRRACEILDCARTDIIGNTPLAFSVAKQTDGAPSQERIRDTIEGALDGKPQFIRWLCKRSNGSEFYADIKIRRIDLPHGPIIQAILRDTTDLVLAESALKESEERSRAIIEIAADGILAIDAKDKILLANPTLCHLTGYSRDELLGREVTELMPERYRAQHRAGFNHFLATGSPTMPWRNMAFLLKHKTGHEIPVEVSFGEQQVRSGHMFIGVIRDVTEKRLRDQALRDSEARYRALFENMLHGYAYCRMRYVDGIPQDFIYLDVNPAFETLTGLHDVVGKWISEVIPGIRDDNPELFDTYGRVASSGRPEHFETHLPALKIWFSVSVYCPEAEHFVAVFDNITGRKQSMLALESQREYSQMLLDSMAEGMYGVDTRGICTFVNQAMLRMLGYEHTDDLLGRHMHEVIHHSHPDGSPYPQDECRAYQSYLEKKPCHVDNEVFWRKDGSAIPIEYWAYPMYRVGELVGSVVTFQDITQRRQDHEKLLAARQLLQDVIETVPNFIFWKDLQSRYLGCNLAFARMAGLARPEDLIGKDDYAFNWREFAHLYQLDDAATIDSGKSKLNYIEPLSLSDGATRWLETSKVPLRDRQGTVIGVLGVFQDITERIHAEARQRQMATVFESTMEGVMITNAKAGIIAVNHAFTEITGYTEAEVIGKNPRLLQSGRQDVSFFQTMWTSVNETGLWQGELWNRRKNGEIFPEWLTINAVRDEKGQLVNYVGVFSDISQIKDSEAQLAHLAHHDPLTNLPNRLLLNARIEHAIKRAQRDNTNIAILFIDLDRFKTVNDSLGHPIGDVLLQQVARTLSGCVRDEDTIARLGGDEFVVVLEGLTGVDYASNVTKKIQAAIAKPFDLDGDVLYISASIGISLYPSDGEDVATLLKNADAAMYRSKADGGNVFRYYSAELTRSARERLSMEAGLRQGIEAQQFTLYYQPQISVSDGSLIGAEALIRWQHPVSGLISPLRFIPLAEETGLIVPLGEWVLTMACEQTKQWLHTQQANFVMAVNLSARQFQQPDLARRIRAYLEVAGLNPAQLELEITESAIMGQGPEAVAKLRALKDLGVKIAIDDFGTGYSSLAYLRRFPVDTLKIDQSFMRDIPNDIQAMEIATIIIAMGRNLHMKVLAEGVETEAQLAFLTQHGCDHYQGYLYSPPIPAADFERFLR